MSVNARVPLIMLVPLFICVFICEKSNVCNRTIRNEPNCASPHVARLAQAQKTRKSLPLSSRPAILNASSRSRPPAGSTRTIPATLGEFESSQQAWIRRIQSGQAGNSMTRQAAGTLAGVPYKYLADWTDRIAAGEVPATIPGTSSTLGEVISLDVSDLHAVVSSPPGAPESPAKQSLSCIIAQ